MLSLLQQPYGNEGPLSSPSNPGLQRAYYSNLRRSLSPPPNQQRAIRRNSQQQQHNTYQSLGIGGPSNRSYTPASSSTSRPFPSRSIGASAAITTPYRPPTSFGNNSTAINVDTIRNIPTGAVNANRTEAYTRHRPAEGSARPRKRSRTTNLANLGGTGASTSGSGTLPRQRTHGLPRLRDEDRLTLDAGESLNVPNTLRLLVMLGPRDVSLSLCYFIDMRQRMLQGIDLVYV